MKLIYIIIKLGKPLNDLVTSGDVSCRLGTVSGRLGTFLNVEINCKCKCVCLFVYLLSCVPSIVLKNSHPLMEAKCFRAFASF